ncbi:hypothetical protein P608_18650 [Comamonas thiooxydans]|uniref:HTH lacI-type domain-containing protein n=1 Tax=Comamonas thiooxydans TaxID=363952 RepID=A0A0E3BU34_9BURK|nr:LacI family DNA-binding transcriptional regulator [Comamonas thiooxydans]KGH08241.1 hypothetical protein P608_18650 [Comamonas thiooxydans]KGH12755.1 hypothetical protein P607_24380 [Comamonas thiooxydans]
MSDVAAAAGVSLVTVSRVINEPDKVAPATLALVQEAVARLGYVPNLMAGSLASNRSRIVAAIVPTISNSVFSETVEGLAQVLNAGGYQLLLGQASYRPEDEQQLVETFLGRRVDGLVLTGEPTAPKLAQRLKRTGIPVVQTWDLLPRPIDMVAGFSNKAAGKAAAMHLIAKGHKNLGFIGAAEMRSQARLEGFSEAIAEAGLQVAEVEMMPPPVTIDQVGAHLAAMIARRPPLDAVFCNNDLLAAGVLFECQRRNWKVPSRLAVIGFGDLPIATAASPRLTTVRIDRYGMGRLAGELLLNRFAGKDELPTVTDIGFEIVEREST